MRTKAAAARPIRPRIEAATPRGREKLPSEFPDAAELVIGELLFTHDCFAFPATPGACDI